MKSKTLVCHTSRLFVLVILVSLLALAPQIGHPSPVAAATPMVTFTVNTTADTHDLHPGGGVCADSNGQCSLRAAIEEASAEHSGSFLINVPTGTYALTLGTLQLTANTITIKKTGGAIFISGNNTFTIMSVSSGVMASLNGLEITHGSGSSGGGILNSGGTVKVKNSTISNNTAGNGGGIYSTGGTVTISQSVLSNNSASSGNGGGISNTGGTVNVSSSLLSANTAPSDGGGIFNSGTLTITHSTISKNAANNGGGIFNDGMLTVTSQSIISKNAVPNGGGSGGGIYNDTGGTATVSNSTLSGNKAPYGGDGGGIENGGTLTVSNSTLSKNESTDGAGGGGGGIYIFGGTATVNDSTISKNDVNGGNGGGCTSRGGGIYNYTGTLTVSDSTISGNVAQGCQAYGGGAGGGIENWHGTLSVGNSTISGNAASGSVVSGVDIETYGGTATLTSTIVAYGTGGSNCSGTMKDGGYNLDSASSCGFTNFALNNTDPKLDPSGLGNNGGPTQTIKLLSGSPAIDYVNPSNGGSCGPATDQRGYARPDNNESSCDIGAYESSY